MSSEADLRAPLLVLERHDVSLIVIGGIAAIAQGYPLTTNDLDVTPARGAENLTRIVAALRELEAKLRTTTEPVEFPIEEKMLSGTDAWTFTTKAGALDLVFSPPGTGGYEDLRRDAVELDLGTTKPVLVASLRDLIRIKEATNRDKDRAQLPALRRTLEVIREREREGRERS